MSTNPVGPTVHSVIESQTRSSYSPVLFRTIRNICRVAFPAIALVALANIPVVEAGPVAGAIGYTVTKTLGYMGVGFGFLAGVATAVAVNKMEGSSTTTAAAATAGVAVAGAAVTIETVGVEATSAVVGGVLLVTPFLP